MATTHHGGRPRVSVVVGSGGQHTVRQFAARPVVGDATRPREATGWKPAMDFAEMVRRMVAEELSSKQAPGTDR